MSKAARNVLGLAIVLLIGAVLVFTFRRQHRDGAAQSPERTTKHHEHQLLPAPTQAAKSDPETSSSATTADARSVVELMTDLRQTLERTGFCCKRYARPPSYFFPTEQLDKLARSLRDHPDLIPVVEHEIMAVGRHHPFGFVMLRLLKDELGTRKEYMERVQILEEQLDHLEDQWARGYGLDRLATAIRTRDPKALAADPREQKQLLDVIADETIPLNHRLYVVSLRPLEVEGGAWTYSKERAQALINLLTAPRSLSPLVKSAIVTQVVEVLGATKDPTIANSGILALRRTYAESRATSPGVCFDIVDRNEMPVQLDRVRELETEGRMSLAAIFVDELRQSASEGRLMVPNLGLALESMDWRIAVHHADYGHRLLLSGSSPDLRRTALSLVAPMTLYSGKPVDAEASEWRQRSAKSLMQCVASEQDQTLRDAIALRLASLMDDDPQVLDFLASLAEATNLTPRVAEFLKREAKRLRDGDE